MKLKAKFISNSGKIKLYEAKYCYFIQNIFGPKIIAGFTKPSVSIRLPLDLNKLKPFLGKKAHFSYMNQTHSCRIALVNKPTVYKSDGLFTKEKNHFLIVKTADCLPVFFANKNNCIGIVHMGWKSAKKGILEKIDFNLPGFKVTAGVGLRSCCYSVGSEFKQWHRMSSYLKKTKKGLFFDPIRFLQGRLILKGLKKDNFFDLNLCSFCSKMSFFSYRKNKTPQRTLSFIGIN